MQKVLVVDDSALMRRLLGGVLDEAGYAVKTVRNGREAVEQLTEFEPDVVTLDINMPEMDGLTALSLMMQVRPTPVVMVSSLTARGALATFEALALGAVDFVAKPDGTISLSIQDISQQLLEKVRAAARSRLRPSRLSGMAGAAATTVQAATATASALLNTPKAPDRWARAAAPAATATAIRSAPPVRAAAAGSVAAVVPGVVLIGVSTGGPRTLEDILPRLPADFPWPVVVAQHMPVNFTQAFAQRMNAVCALTVREVSEPMALEPGHVYVGRGGTDVALTQRMNRLTVQPRPEAAGHPWHPSVDVLVDSALALVPADRLVGVQLTGMGFDGAAAMTALKARGGRTIAESESTAVVFGMPQELIQRGGASKVLPCHDIARQLCDWIQPTKDRPWD